MRLKLYFCSQFSSMLTSSYSTKNIIYLAVPIMIGNLAQTLITFVDTAFLGHLGHIELGAAMMAGLYYYVFSTLAWGFAVGIQIIVARRFGEGNLTQIGTVFKHGLVVVLGLAITLFLLMHFLTDVLLNHIITSPNIRAAAEEYMKFRHYGIIFVCFNFLFRSLYVGLSNTKVITYTTLLMAAINIFFDYGLIFGNFGFPHLGISGAAIASVMAECSALIFFIIYTFVNIPTREYGIFPVKKFNFPLVKNIVGLSLPSMGQNLISFGIWFLFFMMIERMGEQPVAISSIVRSAYLLISVPAFAFGVVANTLTSRIIGEGNEAELGTLLKRIIGISLAFAAVLVMVCLLFPEQLAGLYTNDPNLAVLSVPSLRVICLSTLVMCVGMGLFSTVSGTGNTLVAFMLEMGVLVIYVGYVMLVTKVFEMPIEVIWCAEIVYGLLMGIAAFIYLKKANWKKQI